MARKKKIQKSVPSLYRLVRHLWPYVKRHRMLLIGSSLALLAEVLFSLLEPWPLKWVLDEITEKQDAAANVSRIILLAAVGVLLFTGLRSFFDYLQAMGFASIGNSVLAQVRSDAYRHLQRLSLSFHNKSKTGDLTLRLTADVNLLKDIAVTAAVPVVINLLVLLSMIIVMFWLNWRLALVAFCCLPVFWLVTASFGKKIRDSARKQRKRSGNMAATASESISAIKVVQALSLENTFSEVFANQNNKSLEVEMKEAKSATKLKRSVDVLTAVVTGLVLWYGSTLVVRGLLSVGGLVLFLAYLKKAYKPLQDHSRYTARLSRASAAGERILEIFNETADVKDLPGAIPASKFRGHIRFENINFSYDPVKPVLSNVNMEILPGQHVAMIGPSGAGKSTLVSLILRLYDPLTGRVCIDGRNIRDYTLQTLRSQISIVLQDSILFATTVWENISYGAPESTRQEIIDAAKLANADEFIRQLPNGYDTILGERGVTLSNGQRQRIAIARTAIRKAAILIFDEPTIGLDEENERTVIQALERLAIDRTALFITHDLQLASRMDLLFYVDEGNIIESGTHQELMAARGRYANLYQLQLRTFNPVRARSLS